MTIRLVLNALAICGAATFAGAMLNIGLTLGPYWRSLSPAEFLEWFSSNSHLIGRTIPLYAVPTILGLAGSLWLGWPHLSERYLWGAALLCVIGLAAITVAFHLPMNSQFVAKALAAERVPAALDTWLALHAARIALGLAAAVLGLVAACR